MSSVPACTATGRDLSTHFFNSLGQGPCYIATALGNACKKPGDAALILPSLTLDGTSTNPLAYPGPSIANASDSCQCSTVYYSMLSACSFCQTVNFLPWSDHRRNCTDLAISVSTFPQPIPADTSVPHYAYLDVVTNNAFDYGLASTVGGAESSPISPVSSATSTVSTGSSTTFTTSTITPSTGSQIGSSTESAMQATLTPLRSAKGRPAIMIAPIVGLGVAFLLLVLVVGLVWFCKFRRPRTILIQKSPSEHSPQTVERHPSQNGDQCSVLSATEYSLLGSPPRPQLLEMTTEDV